MNDAARQHEVAELGLMDFLDERREKVVPLLVHAPRSPGPYPVILFSHGVGMSPRFATELPRFWASRGYLCITPAHSDSPEVRQREGQEEIWTDPVGRMRRLFELLRDWQTCLDRIADITFTIDCLPALGQYIPELQAPLKWTQIGVAGHSYGAYIAQVAGGAEVELPGLDALTDLSDPRIGAVIQLAGQGSGRRGLTRRSWRNFHNPMLSVTGTHDRMTPKETQQWKRESFLLSPPGGKFHVVLEGADHNSFGNLNFDSINDEAIKHLGPALSLRMRQPDFRRSYQRHLAILKAVTLAFWDTYLKDDPEQAQVLRSGFRESGFEDEIEIFVR